MMSLQIKSFIFTVSSLLIQIKSYSNVQHSDHYTPTMVKTAHRHHRRIPSSALTVGDRGVNQFPPLLSVPCCLSAVSHRHTGPVPDVVCPSPYWSTMRTITSNPYFKYVCTEVPRAYICRGQNTEVCTCELDLADILLQIKFL